MLMCGVPTPAGSTFNVSGIPGPDSVCAMSKVKFCSNEHAPRTVHGRNTIRSGPRSDVKILQKISWAQSPDSIYLVLYQTNVARRWHMG
jgi:hypothetical protein